MNLKSAIRNGHFFYFFLNSCCFLLSYLRSILQSVIDSRTAMKELKSVTIFAINVIIPVSKILAMSIKFAINLLTLLTSGYLGLCDILISEIWKEI